MKPKYDFSSEITFWEFDAYLLFVCYFGLQLQLKWLFDSSRSIDSHLYLFHICSIDKSILLNKTLCRTWLKIENIDSLPRMNISRINSNWSRHHFQSDYRLFRLIIVRIVWLSYDYSLILVNFESTLHARTYLPLRYFQILSELISFNSLLRSISCSGACGSPVSHLFHNFSDYTKI